MKNQAVYPSKVFLNGEIIDAKDAKISVFDRGFIFGDGVYEVMARINGRFFYKEAHLERLNWCLKQIRIPADVRTMEKAIPDLLEAANFSEQDCLLYMQVSRGTAPRQHSFSLEILPTLMMYAWPRSLPDINTVHASVVTREDFRWSRCDIKSTSLLGNVVANQFAMENGCYETLFVRNGIINEASHCNVFFVKDGVIFTHPSGPHILDGVTRQVVLELCEMLQLEVRLQGIPVTEVQHMDEAFLTGTSTQIMAINEVDGNSFFDQVPGPCCQRLQHAFLELKNSF